MFYPIYLLSQNINIFPLFKDQLQGEPYRFDFSSQNPRIGDYKTGNYNEFQQQVFQELSDAGHYWGVAAYLEERKALLSSYPQMIEQKRYYHVGLDIIVLPGMKLHAPLKASVYRVGIDIGVGNYGGYVILEHEINAHRFFSFYGHLEFDSSLKTGQVLEAGQCFALIGKEADSGYWFTHTHLQILTQRAVDEKRLTQGYINEHDLLKVDQWFPSPYPLFRW